jgi:lysophospholipase L1-like esterase
MSATFRVAVCVLAVWLVSPSHLSAQINFPKDVYYLSLGDSVPAGEGALPVTHGFVYQLYDRGVFGAIQRLDFGNIAIKGATSDEVLQLQVPQALCIQPPRIGLAPSVVTLVAGANDFFVYLATHGVPQDPVAVIPAVADAIAANVEIIVRALVFGMPGLPPPCAHNGIPGVRVLVANYYSFDHPVPQVDFILDLALETFRDSLAARVAAIQSDIALAGKTARVGYVDTSAAMQGRPGLLLINRRFGFTGPFEFEIHPSNAGHTAIAREFEQVWNTMR